jgi:hypothetical protein
LFGKQSVVAPVGPDRHTDQDTKTNLHHHADSYRDAGADQHTGTDQYTIAGAANGHAGDSDGDLYPRATDQYTTTAPHQYACAADKHTGSANQYTQAQTHVTSQAPADQHPCSTSTANQYTCARIPIPACCLSRLAQLRFDGSKGIL